MNSRLQQFLTLENLTPAQLSDMLGIQRSGVSHILSGRNKPGYDFMNKICLRFPHLNANWFITGKGKPYNDSNLCATNTPKELKTHTAPTLSFNANSNFEYAPKPEVQDLPKNTENSLFHFFEEHSSTAENQTNTINNQNIMAENASSYPNENQINDNKKEYVHKKRGVKRVIIFYDDESFEELFPAKGLL